MKCYILQSFVIYSKPYLQVLLRGNHLLLASTCIPAHGAHAHSSRRCTSSSISLHTLVINHTFVSIVIILQIKLAPFECTCALTLARNHSCASIAIMLQAKLVIFEHTCALTLARNYSCARIVIMLQAKLVIFEHTCALTQARNH